MIRLLRGFAASARLPRLRRCAAAARQGVATLALVAFGGASTLLACPVCFGNGAEETALISGTKLGILFLLVITLVVQGAFLAFFLYLRQRAKRIADLDLDTEWSELQRS